MTLASSDNVLRRRMWLGVAAGFLLLAGAWTALFIAAHHARVEEVPLQKGGR